MEDLQVYGLCSLPEVLDFINETREFTPAKVDSAALLEHHFAHPGSKHLNQHVGCSSTTLSGSITVSISRHWRPGSPSRRWRSGTFLSLGRRCRTATRTGLRANVAGCRQLLACCFQHLLGDMLLHLAHRCHGKGHVATRNALAQRLTEWYLKHGSQLQAMAAPMATSSSMGRILVDGSFLVAGIMHFSLPPSITASPIGKVTKPIGQKKRRPQLLRYEQLLVVLRIALHHRLHTLEEVHDAPHTQTVIHLRTAFLVFDDAGILSIAKWREPWTYRHRPFPSVHKRTAHPLRANSSTMNSRVGWPSP